MHAQSMGMRRYLVLTVVGLLAGSCQSSDGDVEARPVHPQPQPNRREAKFTSPCSASSCGDAPEAIERPSCKPRPNDCSWSEDTGSVSYRQCAETECGPAPGAETCGAGTTFRGSTCGSENEGPCRWTTSCVPPRSTTPCPDPKGCGDGVPAIGVLCSDGGTGGLACMDFGSRCAWQPDCE